MNESHYFNRESKVAPSEEEIASPQEVALTREYLRKVAKGEIKDDRVDERDATQMLGRLDRGLPDYAIKANAAKYIKYINTKSGETSE